MNCRIRRVIAACLAAACAGACAPRDAATPVLAVEPASMRGRDILLITLDTTRRDHVGCYGSSLAVTPTLDALCAESVRFDQASAVAPVTLPAHSSLFTGLYPPRHGARYNGEFVLAESHVTLAEHLRDAGWQTAAFVSAFVLERRFGTAQGFAHYDDAVAPLSGTLVGHGNERDARATTDAALAYLAERDPATPLFLWVHYFDPHAPYLAPDTESEADDVRRYAAEIAYMDGQIARLLEAPGLRWRDGLTLVLADHGEGLGEHGERTHGLFVYDSTVTIPLLIRAPGVPSGSSIATVSQVDILPTVLEAVGLDPPESLDGRSLLGPERAPGASVLIESMLPWFDYRLAPIQALRRPDAKYIDAPRPEFYRLDSDPGESRDLLADGAWPDLALAMADTLDALGADWPDPTQVEREAVDADTAARLRSLGYLSGSDQGHERGDPKDAVVLVSEFQAAAESAAAGNVDRALSHLDNALAHSPTARAARMLRARLLAQQGRTDEAEADLALLNQTMPQLDSLLLQAQIWIRIRRLEDADALLLEAARLDPEHGGVWIARGDIAVVQGDIDAARASYENAIRLDPKRVGRQAQSRLSRLPER